MGITPSCRKASVGASELVRHIEVSNLVDAILKLKDSGFWIVAAEAVEGARVLGDFEFPEKTAIVAGSEGRGVSQLVMKHADFVVKIPLSGKINSLNVSQAVAVMLAGYRGAIKGK